MFKKLMILPGLILLIALTGCKLETPEIRGMVLDEETKQPVPEAWIFATLVVETATMQGKVTTYIAIEEPHLRSDERGEFIVPARQIERRLSIFEHGAKVEEFSVGATTIDDRFGRYYLKDYAAKEKVEIVVKIRRLERDEGDYFSDIQALYHYCLTGRRGVTVPAVKGGCDEWELNYAITKHHHYLERFPKSEETRSHYSLALEQLGFLYEKKGEYKSAIENLKKARELRFFRPADLDNKIKRIQQKLQEKGR